MKRENARTSARVDRLVRHRRPVSVKKMMARFRRGNPPHERKRFQLALIVHAIDRETAIDELERQLETFRENRVGEGGSCGFLFSLSYAIVE